MSELINEADRQLILVAKLGKTVGFKGFLKFYSYTDFSSQFKVGLNLQNNYQELFVKAFDYVRKIILFEGFEDQSLAKTLVNHKLYMTEMQTRSAFCLKMGEYFYFDIIGLNVYEDGILLGKVEKIERINNIDYLYIIIDKNLNLKIKRFVTIFSDKHVISVDLRSCNLTTRGNKDILDAL